MKTSNIFSFTRMMQVMKLDLQENWKRNLSQFVLLYGAFIVINLSFLGSHSGETPTNEHFEIFTYSLIGMSIFAAQIMLLVFASNMNDNRQTKEKRISSLMLPATNAEKFVNRALLNTVGALIQIAVAWILADITRLMITPLFDVPESYRQLCLPMVIRKMHLIRINTPAIVETSIQLFFAIMLAAQVWVHSLFILGGSFFYKKPFAKTFGILFGGFFVLATILPKYPINMLKNVNDHTLYGIMLAVLIIFIIANWALSYRCFVKAQVTERKILRP